MTLDLETLRPNHILLLKDKFFHLDFLQKSLSTLKNMEADPGPIILILEMGGKGVSSTAKETKMDIVTKDLCYGVVIIMDPSTPQKFIC